MADRSSAVAARPIWMKQAEEAKQKNEAEKAAAAKAAFEATFKSVEKAAEKAPADDSSDSDADDESEKLKNIPAGPVDPAKCTAAGAGIAGGTACAPSSFIITTKDSEGRKIATGGAVMKVRISPGVGVGGSDQDGMVKDMGDGSYTVTYAVPKRGNYMVHVECDGRPIMGSPFPVFFSAGTPGAGLLGTPTPSPFPNLVNQTMPNMPNYAGSVSGAFPGLLGMIPGVLNGSSGGVILPGVGASLGEVCREYLNGRCAKTDCRFSHPPHNLLMTALAATTSMGTLSQAPMAPSAAAMAAAQAIVAAQALQAHAAQVQAQAQSKGDSDSPEKKAEALKKTLQVSNLSPLLTVEQLKQLFSYCGTVVECTIADSKHFAYIEYSKPEEATAALALNNMDVGGRPLNVEMAKSLPSKSILGNSLHQSSLPVVMQQAVAMQQMQFQQALLMQQTMASQQAASRAATMKSATEMASARAAEISKKLKADGLGNDDKELTRKSRSPSTSRRRSKSRSRSPIKYRRSRQSRSFSPPVRYSRDRRSKSPVRSRHHRDHASQWRSYRDIRDSYSRGGRRGQDRSRDHYSSVSRRHRSRSVSPLIRRSSRPDSASPKRRKESLSPRVRKSSRAGSKSPRHRRESRASPRREYEAASHHSRRSRSKSAERRHFSDDAKDTRKSRKSEPDHGKVEKSRDGVEELNLVAEDLENLGEDRTTEPSSRTRKRSSSLSEDGALRVEEGVRNAFDDSKSEKTESAIKAEDLVENNFMDLIDSKRPASPVCKLHMDSLAVEEDRAQTVSDDLCRSGNMTLGRGKHERSDSVQNLLDNDPMDSVEDKRSSSPPMSKSHKDSLASVEDGTHACSDDLHRHEKLDSEYRKRKKVDSNQDLVEQISKDLLEDKLPASPQVSKSRKDSLVYMEDRTGAGSDDLHGHEKLTSGYIKCKRTNSIREPDSDDSQYSREEVRASKLKEPREERTSDSTKLRADRRDADDSKYFREDRRASDSKASREYKTLDSAKRRENRRDFDDSKYSREDRWASDSKKLREDRTYSTRRREDRRDIDDSKYSREDRRASDSKKSREDKASDSTKRREYRRDFDDSKYSREDRRASDSKKSRENKTLDSTKSRKDSRASDSKKLREEKTLDSSKLWEDRNASDSKKSRSHKRSSRHLEERSSRAKDDRDGGNDKNSLLTKERDCGEYDSSDSREGKRESSMKLKTRLKHSESLGYGNRKDHSGHEMPQTRHSKDKYRHEMSTSEDRMIEETHYVKEPDFSDGDSVDSREYRKASGFIIPRARGYSISPKDDFVATEYQKTHKRSKLEIGYVSDSEVSPARDVDSSLYEKSSSLHVENCQDPSMPISPISLKDDSVATEDQKTHKRSKLEIGYVSDSEASPARDVDSSLYEKSSSLHVNCQDSSKPVSPSPSSDGIV